MHTASGCCFDCLRSNGHGMPFFSLSLKIFATLGITQVNLISALAYSKKSLHWDLRCFSGGIVFTDVLGILDAALYSFFSLTTERVSSTV